MRNGKNLVTGDLSRQVADAVDCISKDAEKLNQAVNAVKACTSEHDIHYYCTVASNHL